MIATSMVLLILADATASSLEDWRWDRKSPICVLRQELSPLETIEIQRTPANDEVHLEISIHLTSEVREGHFYAASIDVYPGGGFLADGFVHKDGVKVSINAITPDPGFFEQFPNASAVGFSGGNNPPMRIAIRSTKLAAEALRACEDDKMRAWGIDPVAWRSLKSRPIPSSPVRDGFSALDYPEDALRAGIEFDAIIRLDIGTDGKVHACKGLNPGSYKGFEAASCAVLKKARFQPAIDQSGTPVIAPVVFDVVFRIDN